MELAFDSLTAIIKFKSGTTPLEAVEYLNVGREAWHEGTRWYLNDFVKGGRSAVRFVMGEYGEGKTHFLYLTAKAAFDSGFVVSYVTAEDARLDKFETVYRFLVSTLRTPQMVEQEGLDFKGTTNGLKRILDEWYRTNYQKLESEVGDRYINAARIGNRLKERISDLDPDKTWDPDFRNAVNSYLLNLLGGTEEAADENETILDWLRGQPLAKKLTTPFGVHAPIKADNSRDKVRSLIQMLRAFGYSGLVLLFDELERVIQQPPKTRNKAYQTMRQLLDNADAGGTQACYVLAAITREVLNSDKGFREYDALWERVKTDMSSGESELFDRRGIIVDLERTPFGKDELRELSQKIRTIHSDAMRWDASARVSDDTIDSYVVNVLRAAPGQAVSAPRIIVKAMTEILEKAHQHPDFEPDADVRGEIRTTVRALEQEQRTKIWE